MSVQIRVDVPDDLPVDIVYDDAAGKSVLCFPLADTDRVMEWMFKVRDEIEDKMYRRPGMPPRSTLGGKP